MPSERGFHMLVATCALVFVGLVVASVIADVVGGLTASTVIQSFQATNLMLGVPAGACGALLAWHRPHRRLGWMLLGAGIATAVSALSVPLLAIGLDHDWSSPLLRTLSTSYSTWTACQFLFLPLAVLHFPDDRTPGPRWRWAPAFVVLAWVVQLVRFSATTNGLESVTRYATQSAPSWIAVSWSEAVPAAVVAGGLELGVYVLLLSTIVVRYRHGDEQTRRQILWLLWALTLALVLLVVDVTAVDVGASKTILALGLIGLVPVSMTVALLRHQLLDIRLVWSRTVAWSLLTAGGMAAYVGLIEFSDRLLRSSIPPSVPAALLVAVAFHPARMRVQRLIDSQMYGDRADPVRTAAMLTAELAGRANTPGDLLAPLRLALRLPYAELRERNDVGAVSVSISGDPVPDTEVVPLVHAGLTVGELLVGVRPGQGRLDPADRTVLALIVAPLALAIHATALARSVKSAADDIMASRRDERRRLRNDLHDGLGPLLTGIAFHAEAAQNLLSEQPGEARLLIARLSESAAEAMVEVRTLIEHLRPTSLEQLGLVAAIDDHADSLSRRPDGSTFAVVVEGNELPPMSSALETALFRIAVEAVTNAAKHTLAERVDVELWVEDAQARLTVLDDGGTSASWNPGVGIRSMCDRVAEMGGRIAVGPGQIGGEVRVWLPLVAGVGG